MMASLVPLQQENINKSEKFMKTVEYEKDNFPDNIKSQKASPGFTFFLKNSFLEKKGNGRGGAEAVRRGQIQQPSLFRV